MWVSGAQQSDSFIHIHVSILFQILFPFRLLHNVEQSSRCYIVGPCWLSTLKQVSWPHCAACGILVPWPGWNPWPLQLKRGILTTGPPGKSLAIHFKYSNVYMSVSNSLTISPLHPLPPGNHKSAHASFDGHLHCFHVFAVVNNAMMNTGVQISLRISVFVFFG